MPINVEIANNTSRLIIIIIIRAAEIND